MKSTLIELESEDTLKRFTPNYNYLKNPSAKMYRKLSKNGIYLYFSYKVSTSGKFFKIFRKKCLHGFDFSL